MVPEHKDFVLIKLNQAVAKLLDPDRNPLLDVVAEKVLGVSEHSLTSAIDTTLTLDQIYEALRRISEYAVVVRDQEVGEKIEAAGMKVVVSKLVPEGWVYVIKTDLSPLVQPLDTPLLDEYTTGDGIPGSSFH